MKKKYRKTIGITFICFMTFMGMVMISKMKEKNKIEKKLMNIPEFNLLQLDGSNFSNLDLLLNKSTVFIYLDSECEYCQEETQSISDNLNDFSNVQLIFISKEPINKIQQFSEQYNLNNKQNITFLYDNLDAFSIRFDANSIPYILIYDKNQKLIKKHKGQLNAKGILRALQQND